MAEQTIPTGETPVAAQVAQPIQQTPVVPQAPVAPTQVLQDNANPRTSEQFEKLLESNRILTEALAQRNQVPQVQQPQPVPTAEPNLADFTRVNPITGEEYIDKVKLTQALTTATEVAKKSNDVAQSAINEARRVAEQANQREIQRQETETFAAYPELNRTNKDKFDERFEKQVRGVLMDSYVNSIAYGGRPLSFLEAAKFVKEGVASPVAPEVPPVVAEPQPGTATTAQEQKQQAAVTVPSQPQTTIPSATSEEVAMLGLKTRLGDDRALAERLKFTEHILPEGGERQGGE